MGTAKGRAGNRIRKEIFAMHARPFQWQRVPIIRVFLLLIGLFQPAPPLQATTTPLPTEVMGVLKHYGIPMNAVSLMLKRVDQSQPVVSLNPYVARNPGSVIKLVTTLVALELLGPTHEWATRYLIDGILDQGELKGNLVIQGGGDPYLVTEIFFQHLRALRSRGILNISGDLIIDDSLFAPDQFDRGRFDDKPYRSYNVIPSAAMVNFSATRFSLTPKEKGISVAVEPEISNLEILNRIRVTEKKCRGDFAGWGYTIDQNANGTRVSLRGNYPRNCGNLEFTRAFLSNLDYTYGLFRAGWKELGGGFEGALLHGPVPQGAQEFFEGGSKPLKEVIAGINKFSNNTMARQLLMTLGSEIYGKPGSPGKGILGIERWLQSEGVDMPTLVLENGSGLSRICRVSASGLIHLLEKGWQSSYRPEFLSSLPIASTDGTMENRLEKEKLAGRVRIKTGLLDHVRSMAGYVTSEEGNRYMVALLVNHPLVDYESGNQVQDTLLRWILRH